MIITSHKNINCKLDFEKNHKTYKFEKLKSQFKIEKNKILF